MAKSGRKQVFYDLSKMAGASCKSFAIREIDGRDEEIATSAAVKAGGNVTPLEEMVRIAVVEVDGRRIDDGFPDFDGWNSKTRQLALAAFNKLNRYAPSDVEGFLRAGVALEADEDPPKAL